MRKIHLVVMLLSVIIISSCNNGYNLTFVEESNKGVVTETVSGDVTEISIVFPQCSSGCVRNEEDRTAVSTNDTGRYDTLVDVFSSYELRSNVMYDCNVSTNKKITGIKDCGGFFNLYEGEKLNQTISTKCPKSYLDNPFDMVISF